jgi:hypothetical protein
MSEIFARFSFWYRLKRFVAWLLRYRSVLRKARERRFRGESAPKHAQIQSMTVKEMKKRNAKSSKLYNNNKAFHLRLQLFERKKVPMPKTMPTREQSDHQVQS